MTSGDWKMGEGRSACFKQTPSRKGDEWDKGVCSSVPLAHGEVRPYKLWQVLVERNCNQFVTKHDGELGWLVMCCFLLTCCLCGKYYSPTRGRKQVLVRITKNEQHSSEVLDSSQLF